jgi:hypothetical protein
MKNHTVAEPGLPNKFRSPLGLPCTQLNCDLITHTPQLRSTYLILSSIELRGGNSVQPKKKAEVRKVRTDE